MAMITLNFDEKKLNKLFPFYILISSDFYIQSLGTSLTKLCPNLKKNESFFANFEIENQDGQQSDFDTIIANNNQSVVLKYIKKDLLFKGQLLSVGNSLLFAGTPWFTSLDALINENLSSDDFAYNDPSFELLKVLSKSEKNTEELTLLLELISSQKDELKKDKEELNRLSYVASANKNGVVFTKLDGTIFWCNDSFLDLTGLSKSDVIGKTPIEVGRTKETSKEELRKMIDAFFAGKAFEVELLHAHESGIPFWSRVKGQPICDVEGKVSQYFAILEDISFKKRYDEAIQMEKEKYRSIIANMNLGLLEVSLDETITMVNQSFIDMCGYDKSELIGTKVDGRFLSEEAKALIHEKVKLRNEGKTDSYEIKVFNKNKEKKTWLVSGAPHYNHNGEVIGSIGIHLDITEQKQQEEQLYLLSLIAEKNINAVIICNAAGEIEWANTSFLKMSGYTEEEIVGRKPGSLLQGQETDPKTIQYLKNQIANGLPFNCEIINYSKTKNKYWVRIQGQALYNKKGQISRFFAIEEDISTQKELESQKENLLIDLAKTNKELEEYAQIVSHDLKSPLRSINSLISWIKEENLENFDEQTMKYFSLMENKVEKMDHLIEGILTYSKIDKGEVKQERVNTNEIINSIIEIIHLPKHITITVHNELPILRADRFRIQQLFQNLIGNAVNYIDKDVGQVEIASEEFDSHYVFSIKDNGVGMKKEIHTKIFETFQAFTNSKHSTGLGLSIVKKIVELYKGAIWLESEEGIGTTFFIKLNK
ncbi:PAS domain S-box protein [Flavobacterium faecale]|uniref:PAS domain S-box protein n=1 Tax=Flavobacterium faecale TaxID=1355330 RepID=UPI003AAFA056